MSLNQKKITMLDVAPLMIRVILAIVFIAHGYGKVFEGGHAGIAKMMAGQGAPLPEMLGWMAAITEFFGGILIGLGVFSRVWGLGMVILMAVAMYTVHGQYGFYLNGEEGMGYEYNLVLMLLAATILLVGPGGLSFDRFIFGSKNRR